MQRWQLRRACVPARMRDCVCVSVGMNACWRASVYARLFLRKNADCNMNQSKVALAQECGLQNESASSQPYGHFLPQPRSVAAFAFGLGSYGAQATAQMYAATVSEHPRLRRNATTSCMAIVDVLMQQLHRIGSVNFTVSLLTRLLCLRLPTHLPQPRPVVLKHLRPLQRMRLLTHLH